MIYVCERKKKKWKKCRAANVGLITIWSMFWSKNLIKNKFNLTKKNKSILLCLWHPECLAKCNKRLKCVIFILILVIYKFITIIEFVCVHKTLALKKFVFLPKQGFICSLFSMTRFSLTLNVYVYYCIYFSFQVYFTVIDFDCSNNRLESSWQSQIWNW